MLEFSLLWQNNNKVKKKKRCALYYMVLCRDFFWDINNFNDFC